MTRGIQTRSLCALQINSIITVENISSDQTATDNSANLSVNADALRLAQSEQWLTENRGALKEYNRRIEARGSFSDGLRRF